MDISGIQQSLSSLPAGEGLRWVNEKYGPGARFSSALGLEDQVITHLIAHGLSIEIFTLDTGRLFQESYDLLDLTRKKYKIPVSVYFPQPEQVEALVGGKGPNSFLDSVENRKECCFIRKVEPLKRALAGAQVWITGVRSEQSANRQNMPIVEWDAEHKVIKYNPLLHWTLNDVEHFIQQHSVPVNTLHRKGFPSIGCAPCTRAVLPGEDIRAGRWWWETSSKECGLHDTK
jgi:phosphoadenosine phosphosulfate reductase